MNAPVQRLKTEASGFTCGRRTRGHPRKTKEVCGNTREGCEYSAGGAHAAAHMGTSAGGFRAHAVFFFAFPRSHLRTHSSITPHRGKAHCFYPLPEFFFIVLLLFFFFLFSDSFNWKGSSSQLSRETRLRVTCSPSGRRADTVTS